MKKTKLIVAAMLFATLSCGAQASTRSSTENLLVTTLGYDIIKQGEKLTNDPTDIKETDLNKFKFVCADPVFKRGLMRTDIKFQKQINKMCTVMGALN